MPAFPDDAKRAIFKSKLEPAGGEGAAEESCDRTLNINLGLVFLSPLQRFSGRPLVVKRGALPAWRSGRRVAAALPVPGGWWAGTS